ncbi:hypothetical protein MESS2_1080035 [Mesorhizobium metallidurans STM 2683]|uniref:Uncharacterized protein n=1 Tax=Mesorhizobium metallidurans STM 2683 TaxID=1297569 RepID=M5EHC9_9HYPH|nr:hypothetical protein MESS2_1080035 [Mesorhizobium metallidurans STM 2683]
MNDCRLSSRNIATRDFSALAEPFPGRLRQIRVEGKTKFVLRSLLKVRARSAADEIGGTRVDARAGMGVLA